MRDLIYSKTEKTYVLYRGGVVSDDGTVLCDVMVLNINGTTPAAYVTYPGIVHDIDRGAIEFHNLSVMPHEGFTFYDILEFDPLGRQWLGWDYHHANDYIPGENDEGKKWTTEEIVMEANKVAYALANKEYDIIFDV